MDDMDDTQGETLEPRVRCGEHCAINGRVRGVLRTARLYTSVCFVVFVPLFAMCSKHVHVVREDVRSLP